MKEKQFTQQPAHKNILTRCDKPLGRCEPFTIVLMGLQRSGTSATAALLDGMGIAMDGSQDGHFERMIFKNELALGELDEVQMEIERLDSEHKIWGCQIWQRKDHLDWLWQHLHNPVLVIPFRDPVAIKTRWESIDFNPESSSAMIMTKMIDLWTWFHVAERAIAVSFERLRHQPRKTHDEIASFLNIPGNWEEAVSRINKGHGYLIQA